MPRRLRSDASEESRTSLTDRTRAAAGDAAPASPAPPAVRESVYQDAILEHFRHPRGRGTLPAPHATATVRNPLCGESVTVEITVDHPATPGRLTDVRFTSDGCSIAVASASMMTDLVRGRTPAEVADLTERLRRLINDGTIADADPALGPLVALTAIARVPMRRTCATMAWEALAQALGA